MTKTRQEAETLVGQTVELVAKWHQMAQNKLVQAVEGEPMVVANDYREFALAQAKHHLMQMVAGGDDLVGRAQAMYRECTKAIMNGWHDSRYSSDWDNAEAQATVAAKRWFIETLDYVNELDASPAREG